MPEVIDQRGPFRGIDVPVAEDKVDARFPLHRAFAGSCRSHQVVGQWRQTGTFELVRLDAELLCFSLRDRVLSRERSQFFDVLPQFWPRNIDNAFGVSR